MKESNPSTTAKLSTGLRLRPPRTRAKHGAGHASLLCPVLKFGLLWAQKESNLPPLLYQRSVLPMNYVPKFLVLGSEKRSTDELVAPQNFIKHRKRSLPRSEPAGSTTGVPTNYAPPSPHFFSTNNFLVAKHKLHFFLHT